MTEQFCQITHEMMCATHWVSKTTGEHLKLSAAQKIIWVQMIDRYNFFRSKGNDWFDSQEAIAFETGCDVSTVKAFIKLLVKHGYMTVKRKKLRGFLHSNSYKIIAPLQLHNKHTSTASLELSEGGVKDIDASSRVLASSKPTAPPQEVMEQLVPVFEDVPLEAYIDKPPKAAVVVLETLQGFADTLDEEITFDIPVLPKGAIFGSSESDPW